MTATDSPAAHISEHAGMLHELCRRTFRANQEKGFWPAGHKPGRNWQGDLRLLDPETNKPAGTPNSKAVLEPGRNVGEALMLITTELAEAMECYRKKGLRGQSNILPIPHFDEEIADALIRIFDLIGGLGIDIELALESKLRYNEGRAHLHGKRL